MSSLEINPPQTEKQPEQSLTPEEARPQIFKLTIAKAEQLKGKFTYEDKTLLIINLNALWELFVIQGKSHLIELLENFEPNINDIYFFARRKDPHTSYDLMLGAFRAVAESESQKSYYISFFNLFTLNDQSKSITLPPPQQNPILRQVNFVFIQNSLLLPAICNGKSFYQNNY